VRSPGTIHMTPYMGDITTNRISVVHDRSAPLEGIGTVMLTRIKPRALHKRNNLSLDYRNGATARRQIPGKRTNPPGCRIGRTDSRESPGTKCRLEVQMPEHGNRMFGGG
jgi:hypothetical protein